MLAVKKRNVTGLLACALSLAACGVDTDLGVNESAIYGGTTDLDYKYPWVVDVCDATFNPTCATAPTVCRGVLLPNNSVLTSFGCLGWATPRVEYSRVGPTGVHRSESAVETSIGTNATSTLLLIKLTVPFQDVDHLLSPAALPVSNLAVGQTGVVASGEPSTGLFQISNPSVIGTFAPETFNAESTTSSLCSSDLGSGLVVQSGGTNTVVGIATTTPGSCNGSTVAWTGISVMANLPWIVSTISSNSTLGDFGEKAQLYSGLDFDLPSTWETISGDFNGDGRSDYARVGATGAWLYFGQTNGSFNQGFQSYGGLNFGQPSSWTTITGDFDGDTRTDYARLGATGAYVYYGETNGTFTPIFQNYGGVNFGQPTTWQTVVGDFDGDGKIDYGRLGATGAWMYYGSSGGSFVSGHYAYQAGYNFGQPSSYQLAVGDFNGDGKRDYARLSGTGAYLYFGAPGRSFTTGFQTYTGGLNFGLPSTWETVNGDFNGDTRGDYARIGPTGAWVFYGNSSAGFTQTFESYGGVNFGQPSSYQTIVGDFNHDGKADYARLGGTTDYLLYGTATMGNFLNPQQINVRDFGLPSSFSVASGDFNGDHKTDFVRLGGVFEHTFLHN